jgi:hypothetical protein
MLPRLCPILNPLYSSTTLFLNYSVLELANGWAALSDESSILEIPLKHETKVYNLDVIGLNKFPLLLLTISQRPKSSLTSPSERLLSNCLRQSTPGQFRNTCSQSWLLCPYTNIAIPTALCTIYRAPYQLLRSVPSTALLTNYCDPYHLLRSLPTTAIRTIYCAPYQLLRSVPSTAPLTILLTSYRTPDLLPRRRYIDYIKRAYLSTSCSSSLSMNYHRLHSIII